MKDDIRRWENKYAALAPEACREPDVTLRHLECWFPGRGRALDIACGGGANLQWLHERGYAVTGMDGSLRALSLACRQPAGKQFRLIALDLTDASFAEEEYDAIVVVHYLNRVLFPRIVRALRPGGRLFYKTFNQNLLRRRPDFNPDFLLGIGELQHAFRQLTPCVLADPDDSEGCESWVVMEKPERDDA